jgi:hypothetical protein
MPFMNIWPAICDIMIDYSIIDDVSYGIVENNVPLYSFANDSAVLHRLSMRRE